MQQLLAMIIAGVWLQTFSRGVSVALETVDFDSCFWGNIRCAVELQLTSAKAFKHRLLDIRLLFFGQAQLMEPADVSNTR
jgi:hypothetical protein